MPAIPVYPCVEASGQWEGEEGYDTALNASSVTTEFPQLYAYGPRIFSPSIRRLFARFVPVFPAFEKAESSCRFRGGIVACFSRTASVIYGRGRMPVCACA